MNEESQDIDVFDKYHRGEMGAEERVDFEKKLHSDPMLQEQFDLYQTATQLVEGNAIRHEVGNILSKKKSGRLRWLAVAASLAILAVASITLFQKESGNLFDTYFAPYPDVISMRSVAEVSKAYDMYNEGSFELAERAFNAISEKNDTVYFYTAMSQLSQRKATSALKNLEEIDNSSMFYPQKLWYAGLAYLAMDKKDDALLYFREIKVEGYKYKKSRRLVESLSSKKEE